MFNIVNALNQTFCPMTTRPYCCNGFTTKTEVCNETACITATLTSEILLLLLLVNNASRTLPSLTAVTLGAPTFGAVFTGAAIGGWALGSLSAQRIQKCFYHGEAEEWEADMANLKNRLPSNIE